MRSLIAAAALLAAPVHAVAQDAGEPAAMTEAEADAAYAAWASDFEARLDRKTGVVEIAGGDVRLTVPDGYYYLDAEDARAVLEEAWGNPEDDATLGMIFPAGVSPLDEGMYGVDLTYDRDGYVSDADAGEIDYDDLLRDMQRGTRDENAWRRENGFGTVELLGWAEPPSYDADAHTMVWAKTLRFEGSPVDTLNYNVRALGRRGVLNANFIADAAQLDAVRAATPDVLSMIAYTDGNRYADYREGDQVAAYGLAGLVAGGAVLAKKTGLIGLLILFGKKFGVFVVMGAVALFGAIRRSLGGK